MAELVSIRKGVRSPGSALEGERFMTDQPKKPVVENPIIFRDEISRIAETLSFLAFDEEKRPEQHPGASFKPEVSIEVVRAALDARRLRGSYFSSDLFAEPAWDMMLELLRAELFDRRMTATRLCAAAGVPPTTALRWLNSLVQQGLFVRRDDPLDATRSFVELAPRTSLSLRDYFREIS